MNDDTRRRKNILHFVGDSVDDIKTESSCREINSFQSGCEGGDANATDGFC